MKAALAAILVAINRSEIACRSFDGILSQEAEEDDDVWWERYLNKGDISNLLTLTTMLLGALLMM